jgi:rhodanese-related sulfurtransferase
MRSSVVLASCALVALIGLSSVVSAGEWDNLPKKKQSSLGLYMHPKEAFKYINEHPGKVLFIDVRTKEEVEFLGMPTVADANIPYLQNSDWFEWNDGGKNFKLVPNNNFAAEVEHRLKDKGLTKGDTVIVMCRSGDRSAMAADLLAKLGYTHVYTVTEGFEGDFSEAGPNARRTVNGWKNDGLPWTYQLDKKKMYGVNS